MFKVMVSGLVLCLGVLTACGSSSSSSGGSGSGSGSGTTTTAGAEYTATFKSIIDTNCATSGCHGAGSSRDFSTFDKVKAQRTNMAAAINSGSMPPSPKWSTSDKSSLASYLTTGNDFK